MHGEPVLTQGALRGDPRLCPGAITQAQCHHPGAYPTASEFHQVNALKERPGTLLHQDPQVPSSSTAYQSLQFRDLALLRALDTDFTLETTGFSVNIFFFFLLRLNTYNYFISLEWVLNAYGPTFSQEEGTGSKKYIPLPQLS